MNGSTTFSDSIPVAISRIIDIPPAENRVMRIAQQSIDSQKLYNCPKPCTEKFIQKCNFLIYTYLKDQLIDKPRKLKEK